MMQGFFYSLDHPHQQHILSVILKRPLDVASWNVSSETCIKSETRDISTVFNWHQNSVTLGVPLIIKRQVFYVEDAMGEQL